jgi:hypothetical protein
MQSQSCRQAANPGTASELHCSVLRIRIGHRLLWAGLLSLIPCINSFVPGDDKFAETHAVTWRDQDFATTYAQNTLPLPQIANNAS